MDDIRAYLLSVTAAALLCGLVDRFLGKKGVASVAKLITGVFLTVSILQPLASMDENFLKRIKIDFSDASDDAISMGKNISRNAMADIIKEETAAYILEKANAFNAQIQVTVTVSKDEIPVPVGVQITGVVSPNAKAQIQSIIENKLGIAKENQRWT